MAPCCRLDRRRIFLLIFARSLIPLLPRRRRRPLGNRINVFSVPSAYRASLQAAPRFPSPHLVHDGHAPSDGASSSFRPWGETRCRGEGTAAHRGAADTPKKHCQSGIRVHHAENPRNRRRRQLKELFSLLASGPNCRPDVTLCQISTIEPDLSLRAYNRPKFAFPT